ncbi:MAG: O-antigen ligase family protein [Bacteroidota bacterium]
MMVQQWNRADGPTKSFALLALFTLTCVWAGVATQTYWPVLLPGLVFVFYQAITDFRPLFYLLFFCIPLSTEVYLPGGFGTDLPTEPLMIGLTGIFLFHAARHGPRYPASFYAHPLALLLYLHITWILLTTLFSPGLLVSIKFSLAKLWYVAAFFLLPGLLIREPADVRKVVWIVFFPLLFVAFQSVLRHATFGFSFADQYKTLSPFMRNHVAYAGILAVFAPWLVYLMLDSKRGNWKRWALYGVVIFWIIAVYFSYTRAAYVSLLLSAGTFFVVRWRLMRYGLALAVVGALVGIASLLRNNNYLEYAPNYETTIAHERFDNLIEATYKLEDISTMERAYRWVAGSNMIPYRPWFGWGPGNFVNFYKGFTVSSFTTYVSDNPENSGIHSYFLMTLVEQGWPGLFILLVFLFAILLYGEWAYHRVKDPIRRATIMAAVLSMVVIDAFLLINDMLETDKMGSFFFFNLAVIILMSGRKETSQVQAGNPISQIG